MSEDNIMTKYLKIGLDPTSEVEDWPALKGARKALEEDKNIEIIVPIKKEYIHELMHEYNEPRLRFEAVEKPGKAASLRKLTEQAVYGNLEAIITATDTRAVAVSAAKLGMYSETLSIPAIIVPIPWIRYKGNDIHVDGFSYLLDAGENTSCTPEILRDFAIMGSTYLKSVFGIIKPTISLVNIGEQRGKGRELERQAFSLLENHFSEIDGTTFKGNAEPEHIFDGYSDIYVTDGFTGNIILKTGETIIKKVFQFVKKGIYQEPSFFERTKRKTGAKLLYDLFFELKSLFDPASYGGAPLLGLDFCIIKCHGNSNETAFYNAIRNATTFERTEVIANSKKEFSTIKV
ncbi:hypothetical protein JW851_02040 [Candidatus Woesearchaeota archaeon]|nr:hypothetical protein [Candidatus Woesearchaeota archaeon]